MKDFLDFASSKYYAGEPVISDDEFDKLAALHKYETVGAKVDLARAVAHAFPMYSLQKCFVGEKAIDLPGEVVETPKLDGAAVALTYYKGKLVQALTRGDGKQGLDITEKMRVIVPTSMDDTYVEHGSRLVQITGEVVAPKTIPNARNYAAGALNLKSLDEFVSREVSFIAYGMTPSIYPTWTEDMAFLSQYNGFRTVLSANCDKYPQDGAVFRVNDNKVFKSLGFTAKHPRGAYALKEVPEGVITTLNDVIWQVGRSGVVAPVAILEPIKINDALISKATLHNYKYITDLNLEIGCQVEIIRSGEIIPRVVRRVYDNGN